MGLLTDENADGSTEVTLRVVATTTEHWHFLACFCFGCCWSPDDVAPDIGPNKSHIACDATHAYIYACDRAGDAPFPESYRDTLTRNVLRIVLDYHPVPSLGIKRRSFFCLPCILIAYVCLHSYVSLWSRFRNSWVTF